MSTAAAGVTRMAKFTGRPAFWSDISGFLLLWRLDVEQPVLLTSHAEPLPVLPVFSGKDQLDEAVSWMRPPPHRVKQITDGREFLESVRGQVLVAVDPYPFEGKLRFTGVFLPEDLPPEAPGSTRPNPGS